MASDPSARESGSGALPPTAQPARTNSPLLFFALTFAVTWSCYIPVAIAIPVRSPLGGFLVLLGTFAPSMVALALTARGEGRAGVRALIGRIFQTGVAAHYYVFAVGYIAAIKLAAALVHRAALGDWPRFGTLPLYLIPLAIMVSTPVQAGEEIGWRGYALPRLATRLGLAPASLLLGAIWALWHLPLFFVRDADTYGQSFPLYAIQVIGISVTIAWLWARNGGSLLLPMLLHAAVNNTKDIVPSAVPGATNPFALSTSLVAWIAVALLWIGATCFLVWMMRTERQRGASGAYAVAGHVPNGRR